MNFLDAIILIPLVWGAFNGFRKGLVIEVSSLLALILGIFGAVKFSFIAGEYLSANFDWSASAVQIISFVITFLVIVVIVHLIARGVEKVVKAVALGMVNRILGSVFGTLKYLILVSVLFYFVSRIDHRYPFIGEDKKKNSLLYNTITGLVPMIYPEIQEKAKEDQSFIA